MDVIALHQAGFNNAVASLGTAFTSGHTALIKRYVNEVVLTFDSDGAGVAAALRAIPILRKAGIKIKVLDMKPYKDPDEFIKNLSAEESPIYDHISEVPPNIQKTSSHPVVRGTSSYKALPPSP